MTKATIAILVALSAFLAFAQSPYPALTNDGRQRIQRTGPVRPATLAADPQRHSVGDAEDQWRRRPVRLLR
jgi:hypothetical protein